MSGGYRAFAQNINRQSAVEVRRKASSAAGYLPRGEVPRSASGSLTSNSFSLQTVPLTDVVDPPDFEEIVSQQKSHEQDGCIPFVEFPEDDISVVRVPRKFRTVLPAAPEHSQHLDPHVADCLECYTSDHSLFLRRYLLYSSSQNEREKALEIASVQHSLRKLDYEIDVVEDLEPLQRSQTKRSSIRLNDMPRQSWASANSGAFDLKASQADPLLPNLLDQTPIDDIDRQNEAQRATGRHEELFALYPPQDEEDCVERRPRPLPPGEQFGFRILVKCLTLQLDLEVEPVFASMTLYDAKEKKKISETFYFDMLSEDMKSMLGRHIRHQDLSTLSRACVFNITYPSPDIFLVIRLEKVLQQGDATEHYTKDKDSVNREKVAALAAQFCDKLGCYRMPFAWAAIHLHAVLSGSNSLERSENSAVAGGGGIVGTAQTATGSSSGSSDKDSAGSTGSLDRRTGLASQFESFRRRRDESLTRGVAPPSADQRVRSSAGPPLDKRSSWAEDTAGIAGVTFDSFRPVTLTINSFFKQECDKLGDDDLYKFLGDMKKQSAVIKKLKCILGTIKLDVSPCPPEVKHCLSPELLKISPYSDEKLRPTKEILEFPPREILTPFTSYRNLLYVYPKNLNFSNRQGSARNIAVKVQFMAGEGDHTSMSVIFGKSSCPEFSSEAFTAVSYHNKCPDFYDEIKMKLPAHLSEGCHLLFTFYHVSCQLHKKEGIGASAEAPLGYTWIPLFQDGRLAVGDFLLPVASERPQDNYFVMHPDAPSSLTGVKWIDNHKGLFSVSVRACSSVHTQDVYIDNFLRQCRSLEAAQRSVPSSPATQPAASAAADFSEIELKRSMADLPKACHERLIRFLPIVLDKLVALLVRSSPGSYPPSNAEAFETIAHVVAIASGQLVEDRNDRHGRNALLTQYIEYSCRLPHPRASGTPDGGGLYGTPRPMSVPDFAGYGSGSQHYGLQRPQSMRIHADSSASLHGSLAQSPRGPLPYHLQKPVHEAIALQWVVSSGSAREAAIANAWFFFELMVKSMAEHLAVTGLINATKRADRFSNEFLEDVASLVSSVTKEIVDRCSTPNESNLVRCLNAGLAFFINDLVSLMDRGYVFTLIRNYCKEMSVRIATLSPTQSVVISDTSALLLLKLDFMRIVSSHEHFVTLNLPFTSMVPSASSTASQSSSSALASSTSSPPSPDVMIMANSGLSAVSTLSPSSIAAGGVMQMHVELTNDFRQQHFLVGIILSDLVNALECDNASVHIRAVNVVRNLMYNHDTDPRYRDPEVMAKIAQLYLPLLKIVIDALPSMWDPEGDAAAAAARGRHDESTTGQPHPQRFDVGGIDQSVARAIATSSVLSRVTHHVLKDDGRCQLSHEATQHLLACFMWIVKRMDQDALRLLFADMPDSRLNQILDLLHIALSNFEYKARWVPRLVPLPAVATVTSAPSAVGTGSLGRKLSQSTDMLAAAAAGGSSQAAGAPSPSTAADSSSEPHGSSAQLQRSSSFQSVTSGGHDSLSRRLRYVSQQTIKKSVDMKSKLEDVILGTGSARSDLLTRRKQQSGANSGYSANMASPSAASASNQSAGSFVPPSPQPDTRRWRKDLTQWRQDIRDVGDRQKAYTEPDFVTLGHLSSEISMIVLDLVEIIIQIVQSSDSLQNLLGPILNVILHSLALNQSSYVLQNVFATQRSLVTKYPELLFEENTEGCADLCLHLLRHCSSSIANTRSHACASLYMLMRQNFEIGNNFSRVKMQVTMSLSYLVGQIQFFNEDYLRSSLKTILTYADSDVELQDTSFPDQVRDLVFNLHMILSDTVKMKEFQEDPEMLLDLMYRVAKGYQNSPDLRLTWLLNMAKKHIERGNHAEAAQCYVHSAGLVAEYMNMIEEKMYLPIGCVTFQKISQNVLEESAVSDDVVSPDEEGICTGRLFSDHGLVNLLEQAAASFSTAGIYEMVGEVYKTVGSVLEAYREYERLAQMHGKMQEAYRNIVLNEGKRVFGTYFRVGFYGPKFGDLDGKEFVYKEPAITKLPEIAHRLESFYGDRFGPEFVDIIKDSNTVERDKLSPDKAYIQLTYVEPHFDAYELKNRKNYFEKNYNLKRFVYATPFTREGRAHGELDEQFKRKTILTTSHAFPYVKTRIEVVAKEQLILTPIEVAIEDIQKKLNELQAAFMQDPPDPKMLQMVLQGCIGTTVNQGPVEVATVFLTDVAEGKAEPTKHHNRLRLCFKDFLKKCYDALQKNKGLIGPDQREYQRELDRNYHNVKEKISRLISLSHRQSLEAATVDGAAKNRQLRSTKDSRKMMPQKTLRAN